MGEIRFTSGIRSLPMSRSRNDIGARVRRASIVAAAVALVAGCSVWPATPVDEKVRHVLDARPSVATLVTRGLVLSVKPPRAAPGFESSGIAYVQKAYVLDHYATHEWANTPARMLGPLLTRTLEDTGSFRAVVQGENSLPVDVQLDTQIVLLRQNFLVRPSVVELTLRVQLLDMLNRRVLATRYIEVLENAPTEDAAGGVAAANTAVARALTQVASFCVEVSSGVRPSRSQPR